eukprot:3557315-Prymnesium_polylepis.2
MASQKASRVMVGASPASFALRAAHAATGRSWDRVGCHGGQQPPTRGGRAASTPLARAAASTPLSLARAAAGARRTTPRTRTPRPRAARSAWAR